MNRVFLGNFVFFLVIVSIGKIAMASDSILPPLAPKKPFSQQWHGQTFSDPYHWLREKGTADVERYLKEENRYAEEKTKELKPFEDALYKEMFARIKQDDASPPTRDGAFYYYSRFEQGKQYPLSCRKPASPDGSLAKDAKEEVLLDQNALAQGRAFVSVRQSKVSEDGTLLLYTLDLTGFRQYDLYLKDLKSGKVSGPLAQRVTSVEWAADNKHFFYSTEDATTKRSDTIWRLSTVGGTTQQVLFESDPLFSLFLGRTKDRQFIQAISQSTDTWETKLLKAHKPSEPFTTSLGRTKGHKYDIEHRDGWLYVRTNNSAKNFRLVKTPLSNPKIENAESLIAHRNNVLLEGMEVFKDFIAVQEKQAGLNVLRIQRFGENEWKMIDFQDPVYTTTLGNNPAFDTKVLRYNYKSFIVPDSTYDYDVNTGTETLVKRLEIPSGYDEKLYVSARLWAPARDGKKIPISIVYKKDIVKNGRTPLWLYAYGSYGYGLSAAFSTDLISLLDRGVVYALAHIRGGDEMGEAWHDDGMLMNKQNTFNDYVDVAEFLIKNKWTSKGYILAEGGSAGGLLMGAVTNMRPDLFAAVHLAVPFVDVMNTMMDASMPLTVGEYLEWGNPNEKKAFDYMLSYSPYDNLERKAYPALLVTTSYNDSQVMYWEPAKYVAKLRTLKTDKKPLIFKTKMEPAGHGGASGRFDKLRDRAFEYAWMLAQVGIKK